MQEHPNATRIRKMFQAFRKGDVADRSQTNSQTSTILPVLVEEERKDRLAP